MLSEIVKWPTTAPLESHSIASSPWMPSHPHRRKDSFVPSPTNLEAMVLSAVEDVRTVCEKVLAY